MFTIAICDDDAILAAQLQQQIKDAFMESGVTVRTEVFGVGQDFLNALKEVFYDVIFLDIEIGDANGIELACTFRDETHNTLTSIIFITSYEKYHYSDDTILAEPLAILIKSINYSKIIKIVEIIRKRKEKNETKSGMFTYSFGTYKQGINISDIYYFCGDLRTKNIVLHDKTLPLNSSMADIMKKLNGYDFIPINRSYLVNAQHIIHYTKTEITMRDNTTIRFSTRMQKQAIDKIIDFFDRRNEECSPLLI